MEKEFKIFFFSFPWLQCNSRETGKLHLFFPHKEEKKQTNPEIYNQHALYDHLLAHVPIYANGFLRHNYHDVSQTYEIHFSIKAQDDLLLFHNRMCFLDRFRLEKTVTVLGCLGARLSST